MTTYYVDSAGSNTSPYDTWAKAANLLSTVASIAAAGSVIYIASSHSESNAGAVSLSFKGSTTAPILVISADKTSGAPPTIAQAGAAVSSAAAYSLNSLSSFINGFTYCYGVTFTSGNGSSSTVTPVISHMRFELCNFVMASTGASSSFQILQSEFFNCGYQFAVTGHRLVWVGSLLCRGGSLLAGTAAITLCVNTALGAIGAITLEGLDLSRAASNASIVSTGAPSTYANIRKIKLPNSYTGNINISNASSSSSIAEDVGYTGVNYQTSRSMYGGANRLFDETTIVNSAFNGSVPMSWRVSSFGSANRYLFGESGEIAVWNSTVGQSVTAIVEMLRDSATNLKTSDVWLRIRYLGSSTSSLRSTVTSRANVLDSGTDHPSSVASWSNTGMTNPNSQKMMLSFTPQQAGYVFVSIGFGIAMSPSLYIDPFVVLS